jgi:hypothetical protein
MPSKLNQTHVQSNRTCKPSVFLTLVQQLRFDRWQCRPSSSQHPPPHPPPPAVAAAAALGFNSIIAHISHSLHGPFFQSLPWLNPPQRNSPSGRRNRPLHFPSASLFSASYVNSGLAGCGATCVVHPADVVKTRLQLSGVGGGAKDYTGMFDAFIKIFKHEARSSVIASAQPLPLTRTHQGPLKLYSGLSAGLFRQITCVVSAEPQREIVTNCYIGTPCLVSACSTSSKPSPRNTTAAT